MTPQFLEREPGIRLAYNRLPGRGPGIVFIHGFMSDMSGEKALAVEAMCALQERAFVRFDCRGHGHSSARFDEGSIGDWAEDTVAVIDALTQGPQVLVGSSMGGWLMLLATLARPERIAGLVGIAAAPDFTGKVWERLPPDARAAVERDGVWRTASAYGPDPYTITRRLIEDGRTRNVLTRRIAFDGPVRLLHGMRDPDVEWQTALRIAQALTSEDVEIQLVKDGEHRLSRPQDLERLGRVIAEVCERVAVSG
jgi:pimeloyl-ACP methyl ester carboxylesterase